MKSSVERAQIASLASLAARAYRGSLITRSASRLSEDAKDIIRETYLTKDRRISRINEKVPLFQEGCCRSNDLWHSMLGWHYSTEECSDARQKVVGTATEKYSVTMYSARLNGGIVKRWMSRRRLSSIVYPCPFGGESVRRTLAKMNSFACHSHGENKVWVRMNKPTNRKTER